MTTTITRGRLTDRVKNVSAEELGYEIDQVELRFMPFLQYTLMNGQKLDMLKMNGEEVGVLNNWVSRGWLKFVGPADNSRLQADEEFWLSMNKILFHSYVATS